MFKSCDLNALLLQFVMGVANNWTDQFSLFFVYSMDRLLKSLQVVMYILDLVTCSVEENNLR